METRPPTPAELYQTLERMVARDGEAQAEITRARAEIERLCGRIAELEAQMGRRGPGGSTPAPSWVKANAPPRPKKVRHKRQANVARPREVATRQVIHAVDTCPDRGCRLRDRSPVGRTDLSGVRQALRAELRRRGWDGWTASLRTDPARDDRAAARSGADAGATDSSASGGCFRRPCQPRRDHGCPTHGRDTWRHSGRRDPRRCSGKSGGPRR